MLHIIINPVAGNGKAGRVGAKIAERLTKLGIEYEAYRTERPGHATEIAAALAAQGAQSIISVGGDGTAFEISRALLHTGVALGIIPAGTGNDFIKSLHLPKKPDAALDFILENEPRPVDVGLINGEIFLNECGSGFDVSVLEYALPAKKYVSGLLPYLWGVIRTIFHYKPTHMSLYVDGEKKLEKDILVVAIANGKFIGGGMAIAPEAEVDDGLFDVVFMENVPRWKMAFYIPGLLTGAFLRFKVTTCYRATDVRLTADSMKINVDGEIIPMESAEFKIVAGALRLYW